MADAWLTALTAANPEIDAPDKDLDELAATLAPWDEIGPTAPANARLTIRLLAPGPDETAVRINRCRVVPIRRRRSQPGGWSSCCSRWRTRACRSPPTRSGTAEQVSIAGSISRRTCC